MSFKEVLDLDCSTTVSLGGRNKKTGKVNPTQVEGYYIGSKSVPSKLSKTGTAKLHVLQTEDGNVGVWGKTDLDRKMLSVPAGAMIRVTQNGTVPSQYGDMYKFKVEVDSENTIEVNLPSETAVTEANSFGNENEDTDVYSDEDSVDEVTPTRASAPRTPAAPPSASSQARTKALLQGNKPKTTN